MEKRHEEVVKEVPREGRAEEPQGAAGGRGKGGSRALPSRGRTPGPAEGHGSPE